MKRKWILAFIAAALAGLLFSHPGAARTVGLQRVSFIDVGQGDSILLQDGSGYDVLLDGGPASAGPTVVAFLHAQGVDSLEVMLVSHAHTDHFGGLPDVLEDPAITVGQVYYNGYGSDSAAWNNFVDSVVSSGHSLVPLQWPHDPLAWGDMQARVLHPAGGLGAPSPNPASLVLVVSHGAVDTLLTGDIDAAEEAQIMERGELAAAEVLKVAHHGSAYGSSAGFLATVQPREAVISVGEGNSYNHPAPETLARLSAAGAAIWRTDLDGDVLVESDGSDYQVLNEVPLPARLFAPLVRLP